MNKDDFFPLIFSPIHLLPTALFYRMPYEPQYANFRLVHCKCPCFKQKKRIQNTIGF